MKQISELPTYLVWQKQNFESKKKIYMLLKFLEPCIFQSIEIFFQKFEF